MAIGRSARGKAAPSETVRAKRVLDQARDSDAGFLTAFETVRQDRNGRGKPTDEEQNLIRAALLFSRLVLTRCARNLSRAQFENLLR